MIQITVDVDNLSKDQRDALAGFILTFPAAQQIHGAPTKIILHDAEAIEAVEPTPAETEKAEEFFNPSLTPEQAFAAPAPPPPPVSHVGPVLVIGNSTGTSTDKNGLPWDERIHAGTKAINADGSWKRRRGINEMVIREVETELRRLMNIAPPPPPQTSAIHVALVSSEIAAENTLSVSTAVPTIPSTTTTFVAFVDSVSEYLKAGKITTPEVIAACKEIDPSLQGLQSFAARKDLLPLIIEKITAIVASR